MSESKKESVDVIIYRVREHGLEVFLAPPLHYSNEPTDSWQTPETNSIDALREMTGSIDLDPVANADGSERKAIAIEADWHDIPSLRALMYEDYRVAKEKAKQHIRSFLPDADRGAYVAIKEAFKRVMPEQYAFLKELKDIVSDKNQTKYV